MAQEENRPQIHLTPETSPTARITDGTHTVDVLKQADSFHLRVSHGEQALFSASITLDNRVHLVFAATKETTPLDAPMLTLPQQTQETPPAPEHPPITIEGYPIRPASYDRDKKTYRLTLAHHPNPKERKFAVYYDVVAEGDKADELFTVGITDTRSPIHITGDDLTKTIQRKGKPEKLYRLVRAETIEKIHGRVDRSDVLRQKTLLADMS